MKGCRILDAIGGCACGIATCALVGCGWTSESLIPGGVTAGWENVCPGRTEPPVAKLLWKADLAREGEVTFEFRHGAGGNVTVSSEGIHVVKTNDVGEIVIKARPFTVQKGLGVRFIADHAVMDADVDYSSGFLRYHGAIEKNLRMDGPCERLNFWGGGLQTMRGMPCTAPGMTYRKYAQCYAEDGMLTPVIVIAGAASDSVWKNWCAEDLESSRKALNVLKGQHHRPDYLPQAISERELDELLAGDSDHKAEIRKVDGVSRLFVDGAATAPVAYKSQRMQRQYSDRGESNFGGRLLDGSGIKLMAAGGYLHEFEGTNGFDAVAFVRIIRQAMRVCPNSLFIVELNVNAPSDFVSNLHPEEAWLVEKNQPLYGRHGSGISSYGMSPEKFKKICFQWPSYSSRVWRNWVKERIRLISAEMQRQNLMKRVVGIHLSGYHDSQLTVCANDVSVHAQAEYRRIVSEPGCISTNYAFCIRLTGFRAAEEFAREFKRAAGKPTIAIKWCQSPCQENLAASNELTAFAESDALDVMVCQPNYRERLPAFPTVSVLPMASFHLHGKMFWQECDYRTWRTFSHASFPSLKSLGAAQDLPMWKAMYRKVVGEVDAARMGHWLYDMNGEWYDDEGLAEDIRSVAVESGRLARMSPSPWHPDVAVVIDEAGQVFGSDPLSHLHATGDYIYSEQCRGLGTSGVPYETYLAEDVLTHPDLLRGCRMVVFAFMRTVDHRREKLLRQLRDQGTTLVYLSETGILGGTERIGFDVEHREGGFVRTIHAEAGFEENVMGLMPVMLLREYGDDTLPSGGRCTLRELQGMKVLARYAADGAVALAERKVGGSRSVYVCEPSGLTPALVNRFARESGAYVAVGRPGLQVNMNGDFISLHCLRPGEYDFVLPFDCMVMNMRNGRRELTDNCMMKLRLTAGETCRFLLERKGPR